MKKHIYSFIALSLGVLAIAPAVNLALIMNGSKPAPESFKHWKNSLYNMDFAASIAGLELFRFGISTAPEKVVIGKDGWLFLGDGFARSISVKRQHSTEETDATAHALSNSASGWNRWFRKHGVKDYLILIGPDKDSVYPDKVPDWARHSSPTLMEGVARRLDERLFIFPSDILLRARNEFDAPLYYKTDTHWNLLGGAIAFEAFKRSIASRHPELQWPNEISAKDVISSERTGGDLGNFLRISGHLHDTEVRLQPYAASPLAIEQNNFITGAQIYSGTDADVRVLTTPTLVTSRNALNSKRVLWLRDSFGSALAPLMAMTFQETLQVHHNQATPALLTELVARFKPDYVFVTNVERDARAGFLVSYPNLDTINSRDGFLATSNGLAPALHHLTAVAGSDLYEVSDIDPFMVFRLSNPVATRDANRLAFDISCDGEEGDIPVQLYWRSDEAGFSEARSARFAASAGVNVLSLMGNVAWMNSENVTEVRLDLDHADRCKAVAFTNVALGHAK